MLIGVYDVSEFLVFPTPLLTLFPVAFKCDYCSYSSTNVTNLQRHQRTAGHGGGSSAGEI